MKYEVLWIEDESEKNPNFLALCEIKGINITINDNSKDGLKELKRRDMNYDAVILDAKVKLNKDSSPNLEGLRVARDYLLGLQGRDFIPHFIYTGQPDYLESSLFEESYGKYYVKTEDDELLVNDILNTIEDRPNTLVRKRFPEVFRLFKNGFIDDVYEKRLIKILMSIDGDDLDFDDELYFNQLRQILEVAMRQANEVGILHDKCLEFNKSKVILSYARRFLSGQRVDDKKIKCGKTHFPKIIAEHVESIITITNIGSHAEKDSKEESEANIKQYRGFINTPYLLYSLTFKLMDVLIWFEKYINENNDLDKNKSLWIDLTESTNVRAKYIQDGAVLFIHDRGYGFFKPEGGVTDDDNSYIPDSIVEKFNLVKGQKIKAEITEFENGSTEVTNLIN